VLQRGGDHAYGRTLDTEHDPKNSWLN